MNMKKHKVSAILFYIASVFFFISAIVGYSNDNSMATVWLCLGVSMLCLGSVHFSKKDKEKK